MNKLPKIIVLVFIGICAILPSCKKCSKCFKYQGTDDSKGRPEYEKVGAEFCGDELDEKKAITVLNADSSVFVLQYQCESDR